MAEYDKHEVKGRLEANRRRRPTWRDSDAYLNALLVVVGILILGAFGFMMLALFL